MIVLISDFNQFDDPCFNYCKLLQKHNDLISIFIYDQLEKDPPKPNIYAISDGSAISRMDTHDANFAAAYSHRFKQLFDFIKTGFTRLKIPFLVLSTEDFVVQTLLRQINPEAFNNNFNL